MDYASLSDNIKTGISSIKEGSRGISAANFSGFWSGNAHDNLTNKLTTAMSNLNTQLGLLSKFSDAMSKLNQYKKDKTQLTENEKKISDLSADIEKNSSQIASLQTTNSNLQNDMNTLKAAIEAICNSIEPFSAQDSVISF